MIEEAGGGMGGLVSGGIDSGRPLGVGKGRPKELLPGSGGWLPEGITDRCGR